MKKIRIRFIQHEKPIPYYTAQRRTWYGRWFDFLYYSHICGMFVSHQYSSDSKDALLEIILKEHYGISPEIAKIIEYPTIISPDHR